MLKRRLFLRFGGRIAGRLPPLPVKYLELLVAASPYLIDALTLLQRRFRNRPVLHDVQETRPIGDDEQSSGGQSSPLPGTHPRHIPAEPPDLRTHPSINAHDTERTS